MKVYIVSGFYIYDEYNLCETDSMGAELFKTVYGTDSIKTELFKTVKEANEKVRELYGEYSGNCEFDEIEYSNEYADYLPLSIVAYNSDTGSRVIINNEEFDL